MGTSNSKIKEEKCIKEAQDPISGEILEIILRQSKESLCSITINNKGQKGHGTGFFCIIPFPDKIKRLPVLITNNHVLGREAISKSNKIKLSLNDEIIQKELIIDEARKTYTNEQYDVTIIEIMKEDNLDFDKFLEIDENIFVLNVCQKFRHQSIYLLYYSINEKSTFSNGKIDKVDEKDKYTIYHKCSTFPGSSGCPIMNLNNNRVIGIHRGELRNEEYNIGIIITIPIKMFYEENKNKLRAKKKKKKKSK